VLVNKHSRTFFHVISLFAIDILLKCFLNLIGTTIAKIDHIFMSDILLDTGSDHSVAR